MKKNNGFNTDSICMCIVFLTTLVAIVGACDVVSKNSIRRDILNEISIDALRRENKNLSKEVEELKKKVEEK